MRPSGVKRAKLRYSQIVLDDSAIRKASTACTAGLQPAIKPRVGSIQTFQIFIHEKGYANQRFDYFTHCFGKCLWFNGLVHDRNGRMTATHQLPMLMSG
jgi:hypothetical protein